MGNKVSIWWRIPPVWWDVITLLINAPLALLFGLMLWDGFTRGHDGGGLFVLLGFAATFALAGRSVIRLTRAAIPEQARPQWFNEDNAAAFVVGAPFVLIGLLVALLSLWWKPIVIGATLLLVVSVSLIYAGTHGWIP